MSVNAYLIFNGNCREAVEFYAGVFGTEPAQLMTFGDGPANPEYPLPEEAKSLIMHTRLNISGSSVMFSDAFPGMPYTQGDNFNLAIVSDDAEELRNAYIQLKEGGSVVMELQETFWSKLYGAVTDKFGIAWQFNLGPGEVEA